MFKREEVLITLTFFIYGCGAQQPAKETPPKEAAPAETPEQKKAAAPKDASKAKAALLAIAADDEEEEAQEAALPETQRIQSPKKKNWAARYRSPFLTIDPKGHTGKIKDVMFTRYGRYLVSASYDKTVRVWRTYSGALVRTIRGEVGPGANGRIYSAALSPDDRWLALGVRAGERHLIRLLDFNSGETLSLLSGHGELVSSLDFAPDGRLLISGSHDKTARLWDASQRRHKHTLRGHTGKVLAVAMSGDSRLAATGSADSTVKLWDTYDGRLRATLDGHRGAVRAVAFTPDGRYLLTGGDDRTVRLWDAVTGRFIRVLASQESSVSSLSVSPDSSRVLTGCSQGKTVNYIFDIPSGRPVTSFDKHDNIVLATAFSEDGSTVATAGGSNHDIYLWNPSTGYTKRKISSSGAAVWSVGFSKDGGSVAWGKTFEQRGVDTYQLNGPLEQSFQIMEGDHADLYRSNTLYSGDGYHRALEAAGNVSVRTADGRIHPTLQILNGNRVAFEITRDASSGRDHRCFTLTPDGRTVISGGANGELSGFDTGSGRLTTEFVGHEGDLLALAVSPDGRTLVSGSNDQTVRLWDVASGRLLLTIFETDSGQWVAWTEEGYYTSSAYGDSYIGWQINQGLDTTPLYYSASTLSSMFRYPGLVGYYLETGGLIDEAWELASKIYDVRRYYLSDVERIAPPYVEIVDPNVRYSYISGGSVRIRARAISRTGAPVTDLWVLVNGRRVNQYWGVSTSFSHHDTYAEIDITIPLHERYNRISVVAENQYAVSDPISIEVQTAETITPYNQMDYKPKLYVLSIGISDNRDTKYRLKYAHEDASAIDRLMKRQSDKLFSAVRTKLLTDRQATRRAIIDGLDWLKQATTRDVALIFLSGHGLKDSRGDYYFLPYDGDGDALSRSAVKWQDFKNVLETLPSKVILMADTCHSGDITGSHRRSKGKRKDITDALRDLIVSGAGVVVLTASTGYEQSWEDDKWKHGAFTKAIVEGMERKADYNKDKVIYLKELDLYITERVRKLTKGEQHPTTEIPQTMPDFPLAYL